MKIFRILYLIMMVLLAGCKPVDGNLDTPTAPSLQDSPSKHAPTNTSTITAIPLAKWTSLPIHTVEPTVSPIPTITVVVVPTATSAPVIKCPVKDSPLTLNLVTDSNNKISDFESAILKFLNAGGMPKNAIETLAREFNFKSWQLSDADLTGDNIPELIISNKWLYVFSCVENGYQVVMKGEPGTCGFSACSPAIRYIGDMNQDGISEIIIVRTDAVNNIQNLYYQILEWDGSQFRNLIKNSNSQSCIGPDLHDEVREDEVCIEYSDAPCYEGCVKDIDNNGTQEFLLEGLHPDSQQTLIDVYIWDGENFVYQGSTPSE